MSELWSDLVGCLDIGPTRSGNHFTALLTDDGTLVASYAQEALLRIAN
jgi:hypothetical protein